ncbi:MAG: 30S ribosomal protein S20 [Lachnospiraceae bacterium]
MANIKSAKKRVLTNRKRAERNKAVRSEVKTSVKKVYAAIESGDKAAANEALNAFKSDMGKASSKGVYKKNTTSRKISRMAKAVNKMEA